jgi:hypothetical protein
MTRSRWSATVFSILAAALCAAPLFSQAKPDFTGTWKLNLQKSSFGDDPAPDSLTVVVEHKNNIFKYTADGESNGQPFEQQLEVPVDGKEHPGPADSPGTMMMKWDGPAIVFEMKTDDGEVVARGTLELAADGKTITREVFQNSEDGSEHKRIEVYDKK